MLNKICSFRGYEKKPNFRLRYPSFFFFRRMCAKVKSFTFYHTQFIFFATTIDAFRILFRPWNSFVSTLIGMKWSITQCPKFVNLFPFFFINARRYDDYVKILHINLYHLFWVFRLFRIFMQYTKRKWEENKEKKKSELLKWYHYYYFPLHFVSLFNIMCVYLLVYVRIVHLEIVYQSQNAFKALVPLQNEKSPIFCFVFIQPFVFVTISFPLIGSYVDDSLTGAEKWFFFAFYGKVPKLMYLLTYFTVLHHEVR